MIDALAAPELSTAWYAATQRRRSTLLAVLAILASLAFAGLALLFHFGSALLLFTWMALAAIAWRPRLGLYVAFGLVLLFEAGGADPLMLPGAYLHGGLGSTVGLAGASTSPLELLLLLVFVLWLGQGLAQRRLDFRGGRLLWPMLLFCAALVFGLVRGALGGGNLNVALWEARALFYVVACYFVAANTIRTRRHVRTLTTIGLLATGLFALEGAYRRLALVNTGQLHADPVFAYSHETVIFLGALLLLIVAQHVFGAPRWQRLLGVLLGPVAAFTLLATERRAGFIAVGVAFVALSLVLLVAHRKAFLLIALPLLVGGAIYVPVFWNAPGLLGQPARAVRSLSQPDPRDAASNLYRDLEKIDVRTTIQADPLLGVGFGRPFLFVVPLPDLSWWPFWRYEPHHNVLWIWLKTGAIGFVCFWLLMGSAIARSAHLAKTLRAPEGRVFALLTLGGLIATLIFSYVDLGLTSGRVTVFLGTTMGTLSVLDQVREE
ncbi:MAG: O-antigen ligase family protein [Chloroflexi bacterium]|nr:O-antigen ligase family protein [Chloroflexota bacterium]